MITLDFLNDLLAELNRNTFFGLKISNILYSLIVFLFFIIIKNFIINFFTNKFFVFLILIKKMKNLPRMSMDH